MVDIGLNVDAGQYLQTMGQAVAITKQYSGVATGLNGHVADLNKGLVGLTNRMTGFNKVNTVAVDTAAAYQKQLAGIEAKAAITGKSFSALEKTTKSLARSFPIGMGEAVDVVESLMKSGVKSEKQIDSLGKSFVRLGAATGTAAAVVGTEMLQLNKAMGNGISQFDALADSVVGATAKLGGTAPSVIAFSKALAPVAATVGMSQTAVIGLSTAMSSLGEDGYRAANTFNKVMLDMNRSIRDGGPDLKAYADLLGTTTDRLSAAFKKDPTEVLNRFADAVAKQGPNISRQLDALGFDSVRDTRSLTALARAGGPRAAINQAVASYGSGATSQAAEVAMGGVVDEATKLKESMSQVVANVGKPLLNIAKTQLQIAGAVSNTMASLTESAPGQAVLGVAGGAGVAGSLALGAVQTGGMLALGKWAGSKMFGKESGFAAGRNLAMSGGEYGTAAGAGQRMGYMTQAALMGLRPGAGVDPLASSTQSSVKSMAGASTRFTLSGAQKLFNATSTNYISTAAGMPPVGRTPEGQALLRSVQESSRAMSAAALTGNRESFVAAQKAADAAKQSFAALVKSGAETPLSRSAGLIARGAGQAVAGSAYLAGGTALRAGALGMAGLGALGLTGPMLGLVAAGGTAYAGYKMYQGQQENLGKIRISREDIYSQYNSFAESVGKAGKGLVSFSAQVEANTNVLSDQNSTMKQALTLTNSELNQASQAGYQARFKIQGDTKTRESIGAQVQASLGSNASPDLVARALSDVASQVGAPMAQQVAKDLESYFQPRSQGGGNVNYKGLLNSMEANKPTLSGIGALMEKGSFLPLVGPHLAVAGRLLAGQSNEAQTNMGIQMSTSAMQRATEIGGIYGGTAKVGGRDISATSVTSIEEAQKIYNAALGGSDSTKKAAAEAIGSLFGFTEDQANSSGMSTGVMGPAALNNNQSFQDFMSGVAGYSGGDGKVTAGLDYQALASSGYKFGTNNFSMFGTKAPENETAARNLESSFNALSGSTTKLVDGMYEAEKAARTYGTTVADLSADQSNKLSAVGQAQRSYDLGGGDNQRYVAAQAYAANARSGAKTGAEALFALRLAEAAAPTDSNKQKAVTTAIGLQQQQMQLQYAGRPQALQILEGMRVGQIATGIPMGTDSNRNGVIQSGRDLGVQSQAQGKELVANLNRAYGAMTTQIGSINRSSGIQIGSIRRDANLNEGYARQDFGIQRKYATEDIGITKQRMGRDFGISMQRSDEDYRRSSIHAEEDYNRTRTRAYEDYDRQALRAQADFNTQKARAEDDYQVGRTRATRDFQLGQRRAEEDFNKSRTRMVEDFNKQTARMVEDSAKSMYDPFKRMSAQMVMDAGQLVTNLKDQTAAMQKQVGNLATARSMGLSEEAIKALNLSDASNAQQLSRLVSDLQGNSALVGQINSSVADRGAAAGALATDKGNTSYQRSVEDFNTSLARSDADFATSMGRATADFNTSMSDSQVDFDKQMGRADEDFKKSVARSLEDFNTGITRLDADYHTGVLRADEAHKIEMGRALEEYNKTLQDMTDDFDKNMLRSENGLKLSIERMRVRTANAISDVGAQAGANIKSMQEQFVQLLQQSSSNEVEAANTLIGSIIGLNIDPNKFGDDIKAALAVAYKAAGQDMPDWLKDWSVNFGTHAQASSGYQAGAKNQTRAEASGTYTDSYSVNPYKDMAGDPVSAFVEMGKAAWEGFKEGFKSSSDDGWGIFQNVFAGLVQGVKRMLGIASPSRVFMDIGKNVVEGLAAGITDTITGVWERITAPLAALDIPGKVSGVFDDVKAWLGNLGGSITDWVGDAWDSLKQVPGDIGDVVLHAFDNAKAWLSNLGSNVVSWVGNAWTNILSMMPTIQDVLQSVKDAFGIGGNDVGAASWLMGLGDTVTEWVGDAWHHITDDLPTPGDVLDKVMGVFGSAGKDGKSGTGVVGFFGDLITSFGSWLPDTSEFTDFFTKRIVNPFIEAMNRIIDKWNALSFTILGGDFLGQHYDGFTFGTPDIPRITPFALGGIATRQMNALIGEAGYPEAVIPLNARGADVLAATMARYLDNSTVRGSQTMANSSQVVNHFSSSYDYRTQFSGAITVQANDPDAMAAKLAARQRMQRLSQPIGGAR